MNPTITFPLFGDGLVLDIPRYFTIFGFNIYYYALCIVLGYVLAALYVIKRRELFKLTTDNILDCLLIAVPCGIIGARIYYMLFNFNDFFGPGQWGNIFRLRDGGLAVYGGIIASVLVGYIYARKKKIPFGNILDGTAFGLFIGQAIGRWGNFINVEAYGVETELPWRMGITAGGVTTYHHPTFLYESLWNLGGLLIMHVFSKRYKTNKPGQYFLFYVAWYGLGRFMIEGLRVDSLYLGEFRVSQILAIVSFAIALTLLITGNTKRAALADGDITDLDDADDNDDDGADDNYDADDFDDVDDIADEDNMTDEEDIEELSELDGATTEEVENEEDFEEEEV